MSEMTAKEYLETKKRMCEKHFDSGVCMACPLLTMENRYCDNQCIADEAIAIVQKWGEEHPVITLMDKFFEVFPSVQKSDDGVPVGICPIAVGYHNIIKCGHIKGDCIVCWSQPYIEPKE